MKHFILSVVALVLFQSFTISTNPNAQKVEVKSSKIVWKGYKVVGSHEGTLDLKSGSLSFDNEQLIGGEFVIDMSSLICTDLSGEYKGKLEGHLKSGDFFDVDKFPSSSLNFTAVTSSGKNSYDIAANLTIKGITKPISFKASVYGNKATANIKVDRTKFNVKYGSGSFFEGLKDNMIYDEFDLVIDLEFQRQ